MATFVESSMAIFVEPLMATSVDYGGLIFQHRLQSQCCQREGPDDHCKATFGNGSRRFTCKRERNIACTDPEVGTGGSGPPGKS